MTEFLDNNAFESLFVRETNIRDNPRFFGNFRLVKLVWWKKHDFGGWYTYGEYIGSFSGLIVITDKKFSLTCIERKLYVHHEKVGKYKDLSILSIQDLDEYRHFKTRTGPDRFATACVYKIFYEDRWQFLFIISEVQDWLRLNRRDHYYVIDPEEPSMMYINEVDLIYNECKNMRGIFSHAGVLEEDMCWESREYAKSKTKHRRVNLKRLGHRCKLTAEQLATANLGSNRKSTKANFGKKMRTQHIHIKPHSFFEDIDFTSITELDPKLIVDWIEKFFFSYLALYSDKSVIKVLSMMLLASPMPVVSSLLKRIKQIMEEHEFLMTLTEFVEMMKQMLLDFDLFKANKYAKSFFEVLTNFLTSFICPTLDTFLPGKKVREIAVYVKDLVCNSDLITGLIKALIYISNAINIFVTTGSLDGFKTTETVLDIVTEKYRDIKADFEHFKVGDLDYVTEGRKTRHQFLRNVDKFIEETDKLRAAASVHDMKTLRDYVADVARIRSQCVAMDAHKVTRMSPFAMRIYAGSGINKSHLMKLLSMSVLKANGYDAEEDYFYWLNDRDKFQSQWKNYCNTIMIDDGANCAPEMVAGGDTLDLANFILKACNNQPHNLLGADVSEKGRLYNRAVLMTISTNNPHMNFNATTPFVSAIERRIHVNIRGRVKDEYCKKVRFEDSGIKYDALSSEIDYASMPEEMRNSIAPDAWEFTVYSTKIVNCGGSTQFKKGTTEAIPKCEDNAWNWEVIEWKDNKMENISLYDLIMFLREYSQDHFKKQRGAIEISEKLSKPEHWCDCGIPKDICKQCGPKVVPHAAHEVVCLQNLGNFVSSLHDTSSVVKIKAVWELLITGVDVSKQLHSLFGSWFDVFCSNVIIECFKRVSVWIKRQLTDRMHNIPAPMEGTALAIYAHAQNKLTRFVLCLEYCINYMVNFCRFWLLGKHSIEYFPLSRLYFTYLQNAYRNRRRYTFQMRSMGEFVYDRLLEHSTVIREIKEDNPIHWRDNILPPVMSLYVMTVLLPSFIYKVRGCYCTPHSAFDFSVSDLEKVEKVYEEPWFIHRVEKIMDPPLNVTLSTVEELINTISKNVVFCKADRDYSDGLMVSDQHLLVAGHFAALIVGKELHITRKSLCGEKVPGNAIQKVFVSKDSIRKHPTADMALIRLHKCLGFSNISDHFPKRPPSCGTVGFCIYRDKNGAIKRIEASNVMFRPDVTNDTTDLDRAFEGYTYLSDCFVGMCGSPLIDAGRKSASILGIHLGGNSDYKISVAAFVSQDWLLDTISSFADVLVKHSGFNMEKFGIELFSPDIPKQSPVLSFSDDCGYITIIGSTTKRSKVVNKVTYTPIKDDVAKEFGITWNWGAPPLKGVDGNDKRYPIRRFCNELSKRPNYMDDEALNWATQDYMKCISFAYEKNASYWDQELRFLSDEEVVSGIRGKKYINALNMSSSVGKHKSGPKKKFAVQREDGSYVLDSDIMNQFHKEKVCWLEGKETHLYQHVAPKVEPTEQEKILKGKTRVFFMMEIVGQMLTRWVTSSVVRFFYLNRSQSESAVGINPFSLEWTEIKNYLDEIPGSNYIALDFSSFDINVPPNLLEKAIDILLLPLYRSPAIQNKAPLAVLKHEYLRNILDLNGDVVMVNGIIPSGTNITSILGCIVNSLYYRCAYYSIFKEQTSMLTDFHSHVRLCTFGDDSVGKVHKSAGLFTVDNIVSALMEFGVRATNCYKDGKKVKFHRLEELEFLKRKWVYSKDHGTYICPLDKKSLFKSLSCIMPPKTATVNFVTASNIDGVIYEMQFYGRSQFNEWRIKLKKIAQSHGIAHMCRLLEVSYNDLIQMWKEKYCDELVTSPQKLGVLERIRLYITDTLDCLKHGSEWTPQTNLIKTEDLNQSVVKLVGPDRPKISPQSAVTLNKQPVVAFADGEPTTMINIGGSIPEGRLGSDQTSLEEFLARPMLVKSFLWGNTVVGEAVNPWETIITDARVQKKLENYFLFRAKCHIKVVINGNGFYYGRLMAAYQPLYPADDVSFMSSLVTENLVQLSQMPHFNIDPTTSTGGEMVVPFFWYKDYVDLVRAEYTQLGRLVIRQIATLKHANGDLLTNTITVNVYAWFTEVELLGPTHYGVGIAPQSGREEEAVHKPVSQMATHVADAAHVAAQIPVIAPYATALETGARMVSSVASALGYSRPLDVEEPKKVIPRYASSLALTNTTDSVEKLTMDVKQELSIDPRLVGLGPEDELSINHICKKSSYLTQFNWSPTAVNNARLFNSAVGPNLVAVDAGSYMHPTAMAGVAKLFRYWTGSIIFRFEIIASSFHRGRLAITYDPYGTPLTRYDNMAFTEIIDISDTREFEITIGNHQPHGWLPVANDWFTPKYGSSIVSSVSPAYNGVISVYQVNELSLPKPDSTENVVVAVYVRGGEDLRFCAPSDDIYSYAISPQSGTEIVTPDAVNLAKDSVTQNVSDVHKGKTLSGDSVIYMGEEISSLRMLLKRYYPYRMEQVVVAVGTALTMYRTLYPINRGAVNPKVDTTGTQNLVNTTLLSWIQLGFAGIRGSVRYKIIFTPRSLDTVIQSSAYVMRQKISYFGDDAVTLTTDPGIGLTDSQAVRDFVSVTGITESAQGAAVFPLDKNNVVEFEVPYQSEHRFFPSKKVDPSSIYHGSYCVRVVGALVNSYAEYHVSAGEDFTAFFFTGWPPVTHWFPA